MLEFLSKRLREMPTGTTLQTGQYSEATMALFLKTFGNRVAEIRDAMSAYCIHDALLDVVSDPKQSLHGSAEFGIRKIAEAVTDMSSWLPDESQFTGISDARVAGFVLDESVKLSTMGKEAMAKLERGENPDATRFFFWTEVRECCVDAVRNLHGVVIRRIGPAACTEAETRSFRDFMLTFTASGNSGSSIASALEYTPNLMALGQQLKTKSEK